LHEVKGFLAESNIEVSDENSIEISHHYGLDKFEECGAVLLNIINREYCKKLIVMFPNQRHPKHHHKLKEEMFQILEGSLRIITNGTKESLLQKGDKFLVKRSTWHEFSTKDGVIFEEISTTHIKNDSIYEDSYINNMDLIERKTLVNEW
jgi:quercetin dioxygenase-like cupin family protein